MEVFIINKAFKKYYILGIVLMLVITSILVFQYRYLNNSTKVNKEINIAKSIEMLRREITSGLDEHSKIIVATSEIVATNMWTQEELEIYFGKLMAVDDSFLEVYYGSIDNKLITGSAWAFAPDYDLRDRVWYQKATQEEKIIFTEIYLDARSNKPIITIAQPIYDANNKLMGVVAGDIPIKHIANFVKEMKSETLGFSFLMDSQGHVLGHPQYEYEEYTQLKKLDEISDVVLDEIKFKRIGRKEISIDDVKGHFFYQQVGDQDWAVGSFISLDEYNKSDYPLWNMLFMILIIAILIFGGFIFIQNKYILRPLITFEKDIEEIDVRNEIEYRLTIKNGDPFIGPRQYINTTLDETEKFFYQQKEYQEELAASHEELEASYGQLAAMEQELREQYTELELRETKLYRLSHYDQLTGLANRRYFELKFEQLDKEENFPLVLIMADVNGLKLINDSFGHKAGDELLKTISRAMRDICKEDQFVSRIGGDEFILMLPKSNKEKAQVLIKEVRKAVNKKNSHNIELSVSFGIGIQNSKNENITEILKKAEDDMYSNKLVEGPSMRSRTIDTIIQALYEKNPREEAHSYRVSEYCQQMGSHLGMTEEEIRELEKVGLLHDIGKVAISDAVLEKPGALTDDEFEEIKKHPEIGYRILSTINEMSQIAEYVLAHHERFDGRGYPKGLKDDEIPLVSRIISIADAYDAMISDRPYRKGLSEEIAISEIIKNAGSQFDPELAKIFVEKVLGEDWVDIK